MNDRSGVGGNNPPSMLVACDQVAGDISNWLAEHPVILNGEDAREAKLQLDRGKLGLKDLDDERDKAVRPLNEQVKAINETYRPTKLILGKLIEETGARVTAFIRKEEEKRIAAARETARIAAEAEQRARDAIAAEERALEASATGELGLDTKAVVATADNAIRDSERANRAAERAERETHVRVGGGFSRATSLRSVTTFHITNMAAAVETLGDSLDVREAVLKAARAYHKAFDETPPGIEIRTERKI